jgi:hypothetical protein
MQQVFDGNQVVFRLPSVSLSSRNRVHCHVRSDATESFP